MITRYRVGPYASCFRKKKDFFFPKVCLTFNFTDINRFILMQALCSTWPQEQAFSNKMPTFAQNPVAGRVSNLFVENRLFRFQ